jgi:translation initiation factor IF-1
MKDHSILQEGEVIESLPNTTFRVKLAVSGEIALCHLAGKMRLNRIKVMTGDRVKIELTPYDKCRGRIVYRNK